MFLLNVAYKAFDIDFRRFFQNGVELAINYFQKFSMQLFLILNSFIFSKSCVENFRF